MRTALTYTGDPYHRCASQHSKQQYSSIYCIQPCIGTGILPPCCDAVHHDEGLLARRYSHASISVALDELQPLTVFNSIACCQQSNGWNC
jgi:hypothetical protein